MTAHERNAYERGRWDAYDHIANFINALDTADMTAKDVRTAIYAECLEAPTRPPHQGQR